MFCIFASHVVAPRVLWPIDMRYFVDRLDESPV